MGVGEEVVVRPDHGGFFGGATVDSDILAEDVAVADDYAGGLASVFEVLRPLADGGEGIEFVVRADGGVAVDDDMAVEIAAVAESDVGVDDAKWADFDIGSELGLWRYDRGGMDHGGDSTLPRAGCELWVSEI